MNHAVNAASGGSGKRKRRCAELVLSSTERKLLLRLCQGQESLIAQISRLAQSNEDLVQAMAEQSPEESEGPDLRHL